MCSFCRCKLKSFSPEVTRCTVDSKIKRALVQGRYEPQDGCVRLALGTLKATKHQNATAKMPGWPLYRGKRNLCFIEIFTIKAIANAA
jgi:hypothetical protein